MTWWSRRTRRTTSETRASAERPTAGAAWLAQGVLLLVVGAGPAGATTAQEPAGDTSPLPGGVSLAVVGQSTFVAADGQLELEVAVEGGDGIAGDTVVSITVFGALATEEEIGEPLAMPLNRLPPVALGSLPSDDAGRYHLELPVRSGPQFDDRPRVLLPKPGVYPVSIELRSEDGPLAATTTHLVRLPKITSEDEPAADRLPEPPPVAVVLNVSTAEGLTVEAVRQLLADHPTIPMTVILQEGVENQLRTDSELAAGFVDALAGRPVLAVPAIDLDPSALAEIDQADLYAGAATAAREDLEAIGLTVADGLALLGAPLTSAGIEVLTGLGVGSVLDTENRLVGSARLGSGRNRIQVIRTDRDLSRALGGDRAGDADRDGPQRANRVLARLTLRGRVDDTPVVLGGAAFGVDPAVAVDAFLRALTQPGAPRPILVSEVTSGPPMRLAERPEQDLMPIAELLRSIQADLTTYESFYRGGGNAPDEYRQRILSSLTRQRNPQDRQRALRLIDTQLDEDFGVIRLHDGQPVTLAARAAPIPIVLESTASGPRHVMLRFNSDKVVATADEQVMLIEPGTSSIDVELETRSLGVSPLEVSVLTPDGAFVLASTRFEVRSTAVPGLGLLVSLSALGLLGAWWFLDARKRRSAAAA